MSPTESGQLASAARFSLADRVGRIVVVALARTAIGVGTLLE